MKRIFLLALVFLSIQSYSQNGYPITQILGSDSTLITPKGAVKTRLINRPFLDTTEANQQRIKWYEGAQIWTTSDKKFRVRDSLNSIWLLVGGGTGNDSAYVNYQTIAYDTGRLYRDNGDSTNIIYEIINPIATYAGLRAMTTTPWSDVVYKTTNDGVDFIWDPVSTATDDGYTVIKVDALTTGRFIKTDQELLSAADDGIFSPGTVTWTGTGLIFDVSPSVYWFNGTRYETPASTVTLDPADPTLGRIDAFVVDTIPATDKITGTAAANPITPQEDPASQLVLAEILINAGDLTPSNILVNQIYNENIEWTTSTTGTITADFNSATHPYTGAKNIYVSAYNNNSKLLFTYGSTETVDAGAVLKLYTWTDGLFQNRFRFQFFNTATSASRSLTFNSGFGFNPLLTGAYQAVSIPLSAFQFSSGTYNRLVITMVGNGPVSGLYFDNIHIQSGIINIPPQTDYSNKLDSVTITKTTVGTDTTNVFKSYVKGFAKTIGTLWTGSGGGGGTPNIQTVLAQGEIPNSEPAGAGRRLLAGTYGSAYSGLELPGPQEVYLSAQDAGNYGGLSIFTSTTSGDGANISFLTESNTTGESHQLFMSELGFEFKNHQNASEILIIRFRNLPTYADEAAALAASLASGTVYKTATGELRIKL